MAAMKKESDGMHPASHYLVVGVPAIVTTWHLRVRDASGKPDHTLMGAAWAALHGGYRGNKYDGPDKAAALSKLTALYKSEKMDLPSASMSATDDLAVVLSDALVAVLPHPDAAEQVSFSADLATPATSGTDDVVVRTGKLFQTGLYEDKGFQFDDADLANAVDAFTVCPVNIEHTPTVLDGKLGTVQRIFAGDNGALMGEVHLPRWLDTVLEDGGRKVSAEWDRATKQLKRLSLVLDPRVSDAALMAAFSNADPAAFARARHDTASGQMAVQRIHDVAAANGAVCNRPAAMASRHEASAIQQVHDTAVEHGAVCASLPQSGTPATASYAPTFSRTVPTKRSTTLKFTDWITGKAAEEGVEFEDLDATFATSPYDPSDLEAKIAAKDAEISALKIAQERQDATFSRLAEDRRQAEAVTFSQTLVAAHRVTPASAPALAALAARVAALDSTATFAEGETSTMALLQAFAESLTDLSIFTTAAIKPETVAALFNQTTTEGMDGTATVRPDVVKRMLNESALGRAALAEKAANAK